MKNCKNCKHITLNKKNLNQGICERIVHIGTIYNEYIVQDAGLLDGEGFGAFLLINIDNFGCLLHEEKENGKKSL